MYLLLGHLMASSLMLNNTLDTHDSFLQIDPFLIKQFYSILLSIPFFSFLFLGYLTNDRIQQYQPQNKMAGTINTYHQQNRTNSDCI